MQEFFNRILSDIRSGLRYRWYGMALAWLVCIGGWGAVSVMPDVYEGSARVYVDTSSVLEPLLGDQIVTQDVEEQLFYVREALTGRDLLETVIEEVGLVRNATSASAREYALAALRARLEILSSGRRNNTPDSVYSISYRHRDRDKAVAVVDTLLTAFVQDTLAQTRSGSETAGRFLDERVAEYEERLQRAEQALADFKKQHADRLPGAEGDYFQRMQAERQALSEARRQLRVLESKHQQLQEQMNGESAVAPSGDAPGENLPPNSLDARIRDYQAQLDAALLEYTERHPDVVALRGTLDQLKQQRQERLEALGVSGSDQELANLGANPVYQAMQIASNETEVEMATLRAEIADRTASVEELQGLIDEVPEVEAELARLNRDYNVIYEQYVDLVRSRETQELTRKASDADQVDFRVINPPLASPDPVAPPRPLWFSLVLLGSLAAGVVLCYVCAQLWPVFGGTRVLRTVTELPVLGAVTHAWEDKQRSEKRTSIVSFTLALAALLVVYMGMLSLDYLGALPPFLL